MTDFLKWEYDENMNVNLQISSSQFIKSQPVNADDLSDIIAQWLIHSKTLECTIDLEGLDLFGLNIRDTVRLIQDLEKANSGNTLLKSITFVNATKLHRWIYFCVRLGFSRELRNIVHFSSAGRNVS
jgi:hypothetical protein